MQIYRILNIENQKCYIGQTIKEHLYNRHSTNTWWKFVHGELKKEVKKIGKEKFIIETLEMTNNKDELDKLEKYYIKHFNSIYPNGYNLQTGGEDKMIIHPETKNKIAESMKVSNKIKHRGVFKKRITNSCKKCGKEFFTYPYTQGRYIGKPMKTFCSKYCRSVYDTE